MTATEAIILAGLYVGGVRLGIGLIRIADELCWMWRLKHGAHPPEDAGDDAGPG